MAFTILDLRVSKFTAPDNTIVANIIAETPTRKFVTDAEKTIIGNTTASFTAAQAIKLNNILGTNTGDETTATIQLKRPLKTIASKSIEGAGDVALTSTDVGLPNVNNTSDLNKPISTAAQTALDLKENTITTGTTLQFIRGDKTLGTLASEVRGTVMTGIVRGSSSATPQIALNTDTLTEAVNKILGDPQTFSVSSQAAMLALVNVRVGDRATRTDVNPHLEFRLSASPSSTLGNWVGVGGAGGGGGSFNPTITSPVDGDTLKYTTDVFTTGWVNAYTVDKPTIGAINNIAFVSSAFQSPYNFAGEGGVQFRLFSDVALTVLVIDSGVLAAGSSANFTPNVTVGVTYYVVGRVRENKYNLHWSSWSAAASFVGISSTIVQNIGAFSGLAADVNPLQDNPNTFNPSMAWYLTNGKVWTALQRVQVSNGNASTMGVQALPAGGSYAFTQIDTVAQSGFSAGNVLRFDLGASTAGIQQIIYYGPALTTPGGWSNPVYVNGTILEFSTNGTSWTVAHTFPSNFVIFTVPLIYMPTFAPITARYLRLRNPSNYTTTGRLQAIQGVTKDPIEIALSTSWNAYLGAADGTAVSVTAAEYTMLSAIYGRVIGGVTVAQLVETNGGVYSGGSTEGGFSTYTNLPANVTPFAFAMNVGAVGNFRMKAGATNTSLTNLHSNLVTSANGITYFVIKTPTFSTGASTIVKPYGFNTGGGSGGITTSGTYFFGGGDTLSAASSGPSTSQRRYQILAR